MRISISNNQIAHKGILQSPALKNGYNNLSKKQFAGTCVFIGHLLGETPVSVQKVIADKSESRIQLLKELARKYNLRNAELPLIKRESKEELFEIYNTIKEPLPVHFDILRRMNEGFDSLKTIYELATDEKSLEFVSSLQREILRTEPNQSKTIIEILKSKHKPEYVGNIDSYKSYFELNSKDPKALNKLDKIIDENRYDRKKYDSKIAVDKMMKFKSISDFVKPHENILSKYYNKENGRFLWRLINVFLNNKYTPENVMKNEILDLYKTTNKSNIDLRLAVLDNFRYFTRENTKIELKELNKLFKKVEKNPEAKEFVTKSVEQGIALNSVSELNSVMDKTLLNKANYFFENVRRIVALSDGEERQMALMNELENPFFKPKQPRTTKIWKVRDDVQDYGFFAKTQRYILNKIKVFMYNHFNKDEKAVAVVDEQKAMKKLQLKKLAQENKIKLTRDVNEIIKNKLGKRVYNEQEDIYRLKATKIRLSLLPEIFDSIKATRAQNRVQGIEPKTSNRDASRLYELINGSNRKTVRYMLKKCDDNGNRIFDVKQIIELIEKANKDVLQAKALKPNYRAADTRAYYEKIFNDLNSRFGKLKRTVKSKNE